MALQSLWFFLWGLLWAIYFMTDGFDLGMGSLYPFLGKSNDDKLKMINAVGPLWDGNEVWLLTAGGVTFAAFPLVYAVMFSSLYSALMLILFALIIRGVSFEFRNKVASPLWRKIWDAGIFVGSVAPAILFGVAFANIFKGIPFDAEGLYHGNLLTLLNPYGLLGGVLFLLLFLQHGANWIAVKTEGDLQQRAAKVSALVWPALLVVAVVFLVASWFVTDLYNNYLAHPVLFVIILFTVAALLALRLFISQQAWWKAWFASGATIVGATFFGVIGLFPNLFPSSLDSQYSLSAFNASSSVLTLKIMLAVVILFLPLVLSYQIWAYYFFRNKVTEEDYMY